jgi:hypothetical protein
MTLRRKLLVLLALVAATPVALAGWLSYRSSEAALRAAVNALHQRSAQAEAERAEAYVGAAAEELVSATAWMDPTPLTPGQTQELLTRVFLGRQAFCVAALFSADGQVQAAVYVDDPRAFQSREPQFLAHPVVSPAEAEDFFRRVSGLLAAPGLDEAGYRISAPYRASGRWRVAVVVGPKSSQGRALAAELDLQPLSTRLAAEYALPARAALWDASGEAVASSTEEGSQAARPPLSSGVAGLAE